MKILGIILIFLGLGLFITFIMGVLLTTENSNETTIYEERKAESKKRKNKDETNI